MFVATPTNRTRIEHGIDATFAVITHHETAELQSCTRKTAGFISPQPYRVIVIFKVPRYWYLPRDCTMPPERNAPGNHHALCWNSQTTPNC